MYHILNKLKKLFEDNDSFVLIMLAMLYVSCKLTCNPLFFRQINVNYPFFGFELKIISSSLVFPLIYILSDLIFMVSNRTTTIFIIIIGIICDGVFSYSINYATKLPLPGIMSSVQALNTSAINAIGSQIWKLYVHGVAASIIANIVEVLIFATIFKKLKNFFLSTVISVFIVLLFHNIITDYPMLNHQQDAWKVIFNGLCLNMSILTLYAAIFSILIWLKESNFFISYVLKK